METGFFSFKKNAELFQNIFCPTNFITRSKILPWYAVLKSLASHIVVKIKQYQVVSFVSRKTF